MDWIMYSDNYKWGELIFGNLVFRIEHQHESLWRRSPPGVCFPEKHVPGFSGMSFNCFCQNNVQKLAPGSQDWGTGLLRLGEPLAAAGGTLRADHIHLVFKTTSKNPVGKPS